MSLRGRLTAMSALIVGVILTVGSIVCFVVMRAELRGQIDEALKEQAGLASRAAGQIPDAARRLAIPPRRGEPGPAYAQVLSPSGRVLHIGPSGSAPIPVVASDRAVARGAAPHQVLTDRRVSGVNVRVLTRHVAGVGAVQLGRSLASVDRALSRLRLALLLLVVGGTGAAALATRLFSRPALAPILDLTQATTHIEATGDLGRRVAVQGSDEVATLARRFNAMLETVQTTQEALGDSLTAQRQLIADASHELRTPVASLRTNIEVLLLDREIGEDDRRALMADVVEQTEELSAIVSDLIELARGDQPEQHVEDLDLADIVRDALERARRHAPGLTFDAVIEPWPLTGTPERLGRAVNNVLDNAAKFGPAGSEVRVSLRGGVLEVADRGPGVPAGDLAHIFDRFFRAGNAGERHGSGLGLAIVRQVVEAHGGTAEAEPAPGGGLLVRLRFPAAA